jgi:hypothetical protein
MIRIVHLFLVCRFEMLTAVVMKSSLFWNISPTNPRKVDKISEELVAIIFRVEQ